MNSEALFTLVRATLLSGLAARGVTCDVVRAFQTGTVGTPSGPAVTMHHVGAKRYGHVRREEVQPTEPGGDFTHVETQWWKTTLQIAAVNADALDNCQIASDILQGDDGLAALAVERVRPLRVTDLRTVQFVNESDQFEAMPNFDVVLVYPKTVTSTTPQAQQIKGIAHHVN